MMASGLPGSGFSLLSLAYLSAIAWFAVSAVA
jgi:hypothetical protein